MGIGWDHWQSFVAVADHGSLSAAARALGLTQPTLGRHIAALEAALGTALFARGPRGLVPTEAGLAALPEARAMAHAAAAARRAVEGAGIGGRVRLTASEMVAAEVLPPLIATFRVAHPAVSVDLAASDREDDLLRRQADLAVRMRRPRQGALVAQRLGTVGLGLYVRDGADATVLIGPEAGMPAVVLDGRAVAPDDLALRSASSLVQLALVRAGAGAGVVQHAVAARCGLRRVWPDIEWRLEVWLAFHEDQRASAPLRALRDHLAAALPGAMGLT